MQQEITDDLKATATEFFDNGPTGETPDADRMRGRRAALSGRRHIFFKTTKIRALVRNEHFNQGVKEGRAWLSHNNTTTSKEEDMIYPRCTNCLADIQPGGRCNHLPDCTLADLPPRTNTSQPSAYSEPVFTKRRRQIVGLGGFRGAGKTSVAEALETMGFAHLSFADPLKLAAKATFGFSNAQIYGDQKEVVDKFWGLTPREALQRLGTEAMRGTFGEDIWIRALVRRIEALPPWRPVVVSDVRFANEHAALRALGASMWLVCRDSATAQADRGGAGEHPSEQLPRDPEIKWDWELENNGDLTTLRISTCTLACMLAAGCPASFIEERCGVRRTGRLDDPGL